MNFDDHVISQGTPAGEPTDELNLREVLNALKPNARARKAALFHEYYAEIEAALSRNVSKTNILTALEGRGLKLSFNTFNKMLDAERERRHHPHQASHEPDKGPPNQSDNEEEGAP